MDSLGCGSGPCDRVRAVPLAWRFRAGRRLSGGMGHGSRQSMASGRWSFGERGSSRLGGARQGLAAGQRQCEGVASVR